MDKLETCNLTEIVIDTQNGVDGAFERLYKETIKFSYRVAYAFIKNEDDIEDALQNSYMYVARYIKDLRDPGSFESWLSTIVRNECRKHIAKEKKVSDIFASVISSKEFELLSEESIPVDLMEKSEIIESVRLIVDKLPDEKRACIMLYYFEQNTLPEIAEILGVPEGTVKSRLYNGRKILEKELKKLQKKDEALYGISVIPLIAAFFAYQMKNIVVPASIAEGASICIAAAAGTTAAGAGTAGVTGAGTVATGTAAATGTSAVTSVVGTAGAAVATKVAAVAVAAAVATGGGAATVNYVADKREAQLTTVPQTSVTEEYTTAPAFAEKTTLIFPETTTSLLTTVLTTVKAVTTTEKTASSVLQTAESSTVKAVKTTRKATTVPATTTASTTTVVTTREETTTVKATTTKITTTQPTTQKETTTAPTTDASEIYNVSGGILGEYTGEGGSVSVPSTVGGENVTAIGTAAFAGNSAITSVSIPSTVTKIGQEAFLDCTGLKSVSLPSSLQSIGI
ncbi:MAG: sigma-70 family RNA polymerase sigma factor, partial [Oscillospiraceae bacterium]|nr:sigma-70 family RNA polymerase sigma factor [Oscillospiraceae bacterium]